MLRRQPAAGAAVPQQRASADLQYRLTVTLPRRASFAVQDTGFLNRIEVGKQLIELLLADRIVLVIMAATAVQAEAQPGEPNGFHAVDHCFGKPLFRNPSALPIQPRIAIEAGRDDLFLRGLVQQISGQLFNGELIEGLIAVERIDHPVTPHPHLS